MSDASCDGLEELHEFWFLGHTGWGSEELGKRWFMSDKELDVEIEGKFSQLAADAAEGRLDGCAGESGAMASALVIALDQLPRNLHRGTAKAFETDAKAFALSSRLAAEGRLKDMLPCERMFAIMPYQHVEDLEGQRVSVRLFAELAESAPEEFRRFPDLATDSARKHLEIVERFGRFPHRNKALGRETTDEERAWLEEGGESFGQ